MDKIAKNIRDIRKAHGETQKDLATAINVSESAIANYETCQRQPDIQILQAIAEHYSFPVDRLINEDFSKMDFKLSTMTWEKMIDTLEIQLPIICSDKALQEPNFAEAYKRTIEIWNRIKKGNSQILRGFIESTFEYYEEAIINSEVVEAVANTLWLTFVMFALMPDEHSAKMGEAVLYGKALDKKFVKQYVLKDSYPISEQNLQNKRAYVEDSQETVVTLIRFLKESDEYADLADYYTALRYVIGMVANEYSDDMNKTIGIEMLLSFAQLGNKYVIRYLKAVKNI